MSELPHHRVYEHRDSLVGVAMSYLDILDTALIQLRIAERDRDAAKTQAADLIADLRRLEIDMLGKPTTQWGPKLNAILDRHVRKQRLNQMIRDGEEAGAYDDTEADR